MGWDKMGNKLIGEEELDEEFSIKRKIKKVAISLDDNFKIAPTNDLMFVIIVRTYYILTDDNDCVLRFSTSSAAEQFLDNYFQHMKKIKDFKIAHPEYSYKPKV